MKANEANLLSFLKKASQFIIPIYQRTYSWDLKQCEQIWNDVRRAGQPGSAPIHFVGSVVFIQDGIHTISDSGWLIIDGQQRLTTLSLMLEALARKLEESDEIEGFTRKRIREYYLTNPLENESRKHKLILSETDRTTLEALVDGRDIGEIPSPSSLRITENFEYFQRQFEKVPMDVICRGLSKLAIVEISLTQGVDNPQLIFESMNSTGKALSQADLIRNFMLMGLNPELQSHFYKFYWRPMELDFGQEGYAKYFDSFMRHFLTIKIGRVPRIEEVYEEFKKYALGGGVTLSEPESILTEIARFSRYFCRIYLGKEPKASLKNRFIDIVQELRYTVATPLLLELYDDYENDDISFDQADFEKLLEVIESYVYRRQIVQIPTNSLNKTFAEFTKHIEKSNYLESATAHLLLAPSYRRFPNDQEFVQAFMSRDMYNTPSKGYWLRKIENANKKEIVHVDEYTIEHLLPQNPDLNDDWKTSLGADYAAVQAQYLHTVGNLTLTAYNSQYSDKSFAVKRDMPDIGLRHSPLFLNQGLGEVEEWNEAEILERATRLGKRALTVWKSISLPGDVLDKYRPGESDKATGYSLDDFEHLQKPDIRALFDEVKGEILRIDPVVHEVVRKLYVAFKAETNFVDIVPQAQSLRLSLNMSIEELLDPRGIARDVTEIGTWGNGGVSLQVHPDTDLKYVLYLIRQSFDKQMNSQDLSGLSSGGEIESSFDGQSE